jgi:protein-tyrosine-phosphatase
MADYIFLCNANMCRSPMAEGIMKKRLLAAGAATFTVASMGIRAREGNSPTDNAVAVCAEHGIDITHHRSRPLIPDELRKALLILVMEPVHVDFLDIFFPQVADRLFMLAAWPERKSRKATINDPVGKSLKTYRKTYALLDRHIERVVATVAPGRILQGGGDVR